MKVASRQCDRAAGVLLATAAGDALGAGYEFTHPATDASIDMIGGGPFEWAPGEWTDDTSMALAIAEVAATGTDLRQGAGLDAIAGQFVRWFDSRPKDIGNQTRSVLSHRPGSADEMRRRAEALAGRKAGNGSLMRTAPVALAYLDDEAGCLDAALQIGALTHDDPTATQACQLWTYAIRHAVVHGTFDGVRGYLQVTPSEVTEFWGPLLDQAEHGAPADFANNGWVVHALQTAWWAITSTDASDARHLQRALEAAVRAGGDTDTTAAIAGGLLGARWGASAVPARWRRILHGWPGYTTTDLVRLAVKTTNGGRDGAGPVLDVARPKPE
ncbi:MAG: ADP-ribosylglycohydrolase family protein [Rhodococcus sp. (in: high G+C Gram-positive bacteria)]|uniref:ADP-ribosylglycohydrolase family protein n=1 Tax=Rhodococcus sp. TaxID=1831 RepID=UPI003BB0FE10